MLEFKGGLLETLKFKKKDKESGDCMGVGIMRQLEDFTRSFGESEEGERKGRDIC